MQIASPLPPPIAKREGSGRRALKVVGARARSCGMILSDGPRGAIAWRFRRCSNLKRCPRYRRPAHDVKRGKEAPTALNLCTLARPDFKGCRPRQSRTDRAQSFAPVRSPEQRIAESASPALLRNKTESGDGAIRLERRFAGAIQFHLEFCKDILNQSGKRR